MREKKWAILDVEYIQTSRDHRCIRKLYFLAKDGFTDKEMEFMPCKRLSQLSRFHQRSFRFCENNVHRLSYYPKDYALPCYTALEEIERFVTQNNIEIVLYKGGNIEKELCSDLGVPAYNIECIRELEKACSHDPRTEVNCYFSQLVELNCV